MTDKKLYTAPEVKPAMKWGNSEPWADDDPRLVEATNRAVSERYVLELLGEPYDHV